ncbi:hypothetical protein SGFS_013110 [Streptomyces graminofaciens]|uniref:Uncharacterized protein n=1 Tax=Streptomyces graminofaciens TaxID=68212 RepID=A0ABM7F2K6_9ACTN|nr:hypothetical protein [Streptomyces graminofaciens]BBC30017.1 hypothetical protein SGFS_013110 [Streptomyces graminofaciens]
MTTKTLAPSAPSATALSFDERLALAALAVDARINTQPLDLADVIRNPVNTPQPAPCPYTTPVAATLHKARLRLETGGWCTGALRDEQGANCLIGAIRAEAPTGGAADDACRILLETIRRDFSGAESIPSWNDARNGPRQPLLYLDRAAALAHARTL